MKVFHNRVIDILYASSWASKGRAESLIGGKTSDKGLEEGR